MSGTGGVRNRQVKPYRRYKPLPALIVIGALGLVAAFVWVNAISSNEDLQEAMRCTPGPTPTEGVQYSPQPYDALATTQPTPPDRVAVRVLNATGTRGQAAMTTEGLRQLGFTQIAEPENDPAYADVEANCHGQIRYGDNGEGAARAALLIDPCMELVKDNRQDATVDLAVGTQFNDARLTPATKDVLNRLTEWSEQNRNTGDSEQSAGRGPNIDQELLDDTVPEFC
ncbi:envelope integrity protein Cei [Prauserella cavernicola]|uniref:Envelope integrity protein Cei n=1 Tax=Prauserella cavernicola TaxID=2800127 RepID=A0A934QYR0_9PSEU|nr:envelope integrity protein Cei [Prauserella cavernicola]MBK1788735.1 envelope integrity protein Cei [Prauserella cavernicola]